MRREIDNQASQGRGGAAAPDRRADIILDFLDYVERGAASSVTGLTSRVLRQCRHLTGAEAGTIFTVAGTGRHRRLQARDLQNDRVRVRAGDVTVPISKASIAGYVAATGETIVIDDAYAIPADRPFRFNASFDQTSGFRTQSIMAFALTSFTGRILGVVQLINRRDRDGTVTAFQPRDKEIIQPANHIVGRALERSLMLERIEAKNAKLRDRNRHLAAQRREIADLQAQTEDAFQTSVRLLAKAAELQDTVTGQHIVRVNEYAYALARRARQPRWFCDEIRYAAQLHDIGKMSVDSAILKKPGALTESEFAEIKRHTLYGYEILRGVGRLRMAADIALCHHEKWDGSGYPNGLAGEAIPLSARIVAVADIYDALRSARPYKRGFTHDEAVTIMTEGDARLDPARHFDPRLLRLFRRYHHDFATVWASYTDGPA